MMYAIQAIRGAVARGWCAEPNREKEMDSHLAEAISQEVFMLVNPGNWAISRWKAEVQNRPLSNIHRRTLDVTWRQVMRHFGIDDRLACGPTHDELLDEQNKF